MSYPKEVECSVCGLVRTISYRELWAIRKGKRTDRCFKCSRPKKGEINSGCFKRGRILSDEFKLKISVALKGKKKPPRTSEHLMNLGKALMGKSMGDKNAMRRIEVRRRASESQRGEKSHNWRGGKSGVKRSIRGSLEYKLWREAIFKRDGYTCILCSSRGGKLEADHLPIMFSLILNDNNIKTFEESLNCKELWDVGNGRTLCRKCHEKTETFGSKGNKLISQRVNRQNIRFLV